MFALYTAAYPMAEINKEQIALWINMLSDVPYDKGLKNMELHIKSNRFPPTIADIVRADPESTTHGEALLLEGERRLEEFERWKLEAVDPPEHLLRRNRRKPHDD